MWSQFPGTLPSVRWCSSCSISVGTQTARLRQWKRQTHKALSTWWGLSSHECAPVGSCHWTLKNCKLPEWILPMRASARAPQCVPWCTISDICVGRPFTRMASWSTGPCFAHKLCKMTIVVSKWHGILANKAISARKLIPRRKFFTIRSFLRQYCARRITKIQLACRSFTVRIIIHSWISVMWWCWWTKRPLTHPFSHYKSCKNCTWCLRVNRRASHHNRRT